MKNAKYQYLDRQLAEWWGYYEKLVSCEIGYPSNYALDRINSFQPSKTIVPMIDIPQRLVGIDRAMRYIDKKYWFILAARHWIAGPDRERCNKVGLSPSTYHRHLKKAHNWINEYMTNTIVIWD